MDKDQLTMIITRLESEIVTALAEKLDKKFDESLDRINRKVMNN